MKIGNKSAIGLVKALGFSIVELMVAILIGLIILAGGIQVVVTSKASFLGQEEMSFIQENARYALDVIGKDIQGAGYWGCAGAGARVALVARAGAGAVAFLDFAPLRGYEANINVPATYMADIRNDTVDSAGDAILPDSILVRGFQGRSFAVSNHVIGTLTVEGNHGFGEGHYVGVVAEDCNRVGILRAGDGTAGNEIAYDTTGNHLITIQPAVENIICPGATCSEAPVSLYTPAATVMAYQARAYYIGTSTAASGVPALMRAVLRNGGTAPEEIALGVENMQILYGVMTGGTLQYLTADAVTAANQWNNVFTVQVDLLFRSQSPMLPDAQEQPDLLGNTYNDRFARQVVSSTFRVRNRI